VTDSPGSLRPLVAAAATDAAIDPVEAPPDDRFGAVRHAVAAISRDLGVDVESWSPGAGTDGWAADDDGDTDAAATCASRRTCAPPAGPWPGRSGSRARSTARNGRRG
jgi:hypothetical protein